MKSKLNMHNADGYFSHDMESGVTRMHLSGHRIKKGSVRLWGDMRDDGAGNIVAKDGQVAGSIDYENGDLDAPLYP